MTTYTITEAQRLEAMDALYLPSMKTEAMLKQKDEAYVMLQSLTPALAQQGEQAPPFGSKRAAAMAVYTPPFKYQYGYIYDSSNKIVADNGGIGDESSVEGAVAGRVRGWGKLGYLPNGAELQDEIGLMMAEALTALYAAPAPQAQTIRTDTSETLKNALAEIERVTVQYDLLMNQTGELRAKLAAYECGHRPPCEDCAEEKKTTKAMKATDGKGYIFP